MLIIEGADLVGKTTLQRELLKRLPQHVPAHFTRLPPGFDFYHHYLTAANRWAVQDRFHLSELAYARFNRVGPSPLEAHVDLLHHRLRYEFGAFTVLLIAETRDVFTTRWREGEMFTLQQVMEVNDAFQALRPYADMVVPITRQMKPSPTAIIEAYNRWITRLASIRNSKFSRDLQLIFHDYQRVDDAPLEL